MSLPTFGSGSGIVAIVFKGLGASLGTALLLGSQAAFAASTFSNTARPFQVAQTTTTDTGDVIVTPEPQRPGSTTTPSGSGSTGGAPTTGSPTTGSPTTGSSTTGTPSSGTSTTASGVRFTCEVVNGQYTVMYHPESQPSRSYPWAVPSNMGGGWSPDRRCSEISRRLESYRPDGLLEMKTGMENGYNTVCVTTEKVASCRIVLTVPNGQDPTSTRDRVFQNLTVADSGQQTQGVNTYVGNGSNNILDQI